MKYALRSVGLPSLALALETYRVWLLNNGIFPVTSETFPLAREFQTLVGIVVGLAVLLSALRHPDFIRVRVVPPIAFACAAVGAGLLLCVPGSPAAVTMGLMLLSLAGTANHYLMGIAFAQAHLYRCGVRRARGNACHDGVARPVVSCVSRYRCCYHLVGPSAPVARGDPRMARVY